MRFNKLGAAALTVLLATGGALGLATSASADELPHDDLAVVAPAEHVTPELAQVQLRAVFSIVGAGEVHHFPEGEPVLIHGTGEPGDIIMLHDENGDPLVDVTVDAEGRWLAELWSLTPGGHYVMAVAPTGETLGIDIIVLAAAQLVIMTPTPGEVIDGGTSTLVNGKGFSGSTVTLYDMNGSVLGVTAADEFGFWETRITIPSDGGRFTITAESEGKAISVDIEVTVVAAALIEVTPIVPVLGSDGLPALPKVEGLEYTITQVTGTSWYVTAFALDGYVIADGAQFDWLLEAPITEPETVVPESVLPETVIPEVTEPELVAPRSAPLTEHSNVLATTGGELPIGGIAAAILALGVGSALLVRRRTARG